MPFSSRISANCQYSKLTDILDHLVGPRPGGTSRKPDSGHADTISITVRLRRASQNAMKPRIQCALTR
jgi:hypothetical protein